MNEEEMSRVFFICYCLWFAALMLKKRYHLVHEDFFKQHFVGHIAYMLPLLFHL